MLRDSQNQSVMLNVRRVLMSGKVRAGKVGGGLRGVGGDRSFLFLDLGGIYTGVLPL